MVAKNVGCFPYGVIGYQPDCRNGAGSVYSQADLGRHCAARGYHSSVALCDAVRRKIETCQRLTRKGKTFSMKKLILPLTSILVLAFIIAGCGKSVGSTGGTTSAAAGCTAGKIEMSSADFVQHTCTIKAGDQITFVDSASTGNYHVLCFGHNETCAANPNGPAELNASSGITFNAGDANKGFAFTKPGTYEVTCTVHPNMNVTITVQ